MSSSSGAGGSKGSIDRSPMLHSADKGEKKSTHMYSQSLTLCQGGCLWIAIMYLYEGHHPRIPITSLKLPLLWPRVSFPAIRLWSMTSQRAFVSLNLRELGVKGSSFLPSFKTLRWFCKCVPPFSELCLTRGLSEGLPC